MADDLDASKVTSLRAGKGSFANNTRRERTNPPSWSEVLAVIKTEIENNPGLLPSGRFPAETIINSAPEENRAAIAKLIGRIRATELGLFEYMVKLRIRDASEQLATPSPEPSDDLLQKGRSEYAIDGIKTQLKGFYGKAQLLYGVSMGDEGRFHLIQLAANQFVQKHSLNSVSETPIRS